MIISLPENRPFDIVGIGRNSWDRLAVVSSYPPANAKVEVLTLDNQPGGQVATTIVAATRLGAKTRYLGKFGDDAGGRAVRGALVREGIDLSESKVIPGVSNQSAFIVVDKKNKTRTVFGYVDPRLALGFDDFTHEAVGSGRILFLGGRHPDVMIPFARAGKEAGCVVAVDADRVSHDTSELISYCQIVICPEGFPSQLTGEKSIEQSLRMIADRGPSLVCCTVGENGAIAYANGKIYESVAFPVDVRDTTGAGDAFQGAFLVGLLENKSMEEILRFANAVGAIKCKSLGGQKGIPHRTEVDAFLGSK